MPQRQRHRGKHPQDGRLFAAKHLAVLRDAVADLSYLLTRGYSDSAALKLVGDHYQLHARQRVALARAACSDQALARRKARHVTAAELRGNRLLIDGYNLLITAETALSGGVLIVGRDGCVRDIAGLHGSYKKVEETLPALRLLGETLAELGVVEAVWHLDSPVSNSGRLARLIRAEGERNGWPWAAEVEPDPDKTLERSGEIVVTSDSVVLDRVERWFNLMGLILPRLETPAAVDLHPAAGTATIP